MSLLRTEAQMRKLRADGTKEASIEGYFVRSCHKWGCMQRKLTSIYAPDGWPDRVCVWPDGKGTADWVELKRPVGGRFEKQQPKIHEDLRARGANVEVLHTREVVDEYFARRSKQLGVKKRKPTGDKAGLAKLKQLQLSSV